jgi:hypothetical protein
VHKSEDSDQIGAAELPGRMGARMKHEQELQDFTKQASDLAKLINQNGWRIYEFSTE